jgi:hypothetical protein
MVLVDVPSEPLVMMDSQVAATKADNLVAPVKGPMRAITDWKY